MTQNENYILDNIVTTVLYYSVKLQKKISYILVIMHHHL